MQQSTWDFYTKQWYIFIPLLLVGFTLPLISQTFSAVAVSPSNSMQFSCYTYLPAAAIFFLVECMWSYVAKESDSRRQTYLHPYSFYTILVNLHVIALIENGVFTLEVILTYVFLSNIITLAYTAILFIVHGKIWQMQVEGKLRSGELTGYILILFLVGLTSIFHYIPVHPINTELNFLWVLPMVFIMFCFTQIVFLEHLMGEEDSRKAADASKKKHFTNSVHLLNLGHSAIILLVIVYYASQLHYSWYGDFTFAETGGKLDKRLNFELAELLDTPSYNNLPSSQGSYLLST